MVMATVSEMNNIISGKAIAPLNNDLGIKLWMSPPYVFSGENPIICIPKLNSASLSYTTKYGKLKFNIAFEKGLKNGCQKYKYLLEALISTLGEFGITNIQKRSPKEIMNVDMDITALIG